MGEKQTDNLKEATDALIGAIDRRPEVSANIEFCVRLRAALSSASWRGGRVYVYHPSGQDTWHVTPGARALETVEKAPSSQIAQGLIVKVYIGPSRIDMEFDSSEVLAPPHPKDAGTSARERFVADFEATVCGRVLEALEAELERDLYVVRAARKGGAEPSRR